MSRNEVPGLNGGVTALNGRIAGVNGAALPDDAVRSNGHEEASLGLSARELEVMSLIAGGHTNGEIAALV
jgi:DNA-binding NarL/FixJ family response regulator